MFAALVFGVSDAAAQGRNPMIFIPGLTGSELKNGETGERVWFKTVRSRSDDIRLPITLDPTKGRDNLVPGDILRNVKIGIFPGIDVYGGFIKTMEEKAGYREEKWDEPSEEADHDSIFVFPYDWRLDNVQNAQELIKKIVALKAKLKKPSLKFDVVAHSMGGIITRYALMYGDADVLSGTRKPVPTWAGARHFDNIILLGTPNEGSTQSLNAMINGFALGGLRIDLPFMLDTSKFTVFSIPSSYQLLPAPGTLRAFDEKLEPIDVDIYDPKTWARYGWSPKSDRNFQKRFGPDEVKIADRFFAAALQRARRLHEALAAAPGNNGGVNISLVGADCKTASDGIVIHKDRRSGNLRTQFRPRSFTRSDGQRVSEEDIRNVLQSDGDGVVPKRSLLGEMRSDAAKASAAIGDGKPIFICEDHNKLAANGRVQDLVITMFAAKAETAARLR